MAAVSEKAKRVRGQTYFFGSIASARREVTKQMVWRWGVSFYVCLRRRSTAVLSLGLVAWNQVQWCASKLKVDSLEPGTVCEDVGVKVAIQGRGGGGNKNLLLSPSSFMTKVPVSSYGDDDDLGDGDVELVRGSQLLQRK